MLQQQSQAAKTLARFPTLGSLDLRGALGRAYTTNPALTLSGVLMVPVLLVCMLGLLLDPRVITGAPAWLKPTKFAISIALYSFTLLWMLSFVDGRRFWVRAVSFITLLGFLAEAVLIITQVIRGTTSHFNVSSAFDGALFSIMGTFVILIWAMNLIAAILLLFQRLPDPVLAWSLRLALLLTLAGGALGGLMLGPTASQSDAMRAGQRASIVGAHSVGVNDGAPGLPITGWSTTGGDLRIGHFIGLHALQVLPIVGWLLMRKRATRRLRRGQRVGLVWIAALSYAGLMTLATWQALRGQPLIAPDATTLAAAGAWLGATALAIAGVVGLRTRGDVAA